MAVDDPAHRRQADAGPLELGIVMQPLETAKELVVVLHIEARTVVLHEVHSLVADAHLPELDAGMGAVAGELPGVGQKVLHHHPQQPRVALHLYFILYVQIHVAFRLGLAELPAAVPDQFAEIDLLYIEILTGYPGERQHGVDKLAHAVGGPQHPAQIVVAGVIQLLISNKQAYALQEGTSMVNENARFALQRLTHDLRMAGNWAGAAKDDASAYTDVTGLANTDCQKQLAMALNPVGQVRGIEGIQGDVNSPLSACIDNQNYVANSDIIVVRYATIALGFYLLSRRGLLVTVDRAGKLSTFLVMSAVTLALASEAVWIDGLLILAAVISVVTLANYLAKTAVGAWPKAKTG